MAPAWVEMLDAYALELATPGMPPDSRAEMIRLMVEIELGKLSTGGWRRAKAKKMFEEARRRHAAEEEGRHGPEHAMFRRV
jgi:hypothetical protein